MNTCTSNSKPCTISSITMNNWLGFSLSSNQDHPQNSVPHHLGFHSDEISAAQISSHECFDLTPNSTIPSIFEAFNTNPPSQDWNMKDESINSFSCNTHQNQETPKLENFLEVGGQSFTNDNNMNVNSNNMGLSMIKNWLRNNAPPPHAAEEDKVDHEAAAPPAPTAAAGGQTLSLSMSTGSQSSDNKVQQCVDSQNSSVGAIESVPRKSIETFGQRTSIYRGVTRHRWTGRYEAHLWDNSCRREGQTRKGRQVYLGGYDKEDKAARSYDLAALKYWGTTTTTNFPISNYEKELEEMKHMTRQEYVASLRRKSSGFSRGASIYRGVTRHHQHGRWQARIGRVAGNKDLYLGTFSTQEEAAEAYDIAAIKFRGLNAVTNFEINRYDVRSIMESRNLPIGGGAKRLKDAEKAEVALQMQRANDNALNTTYSWPALGFSPAQPLTLHPYQRMWCKEEQDSDVGFGEIDHHLQLGNNQSFLQASMLQLHNVPGLESEPGPDPITGLGLVYENNVACEGNGFGYEGVFGSTDRNLYYQSSCTPTFTMWNGT